jgi:hypothetical protein
MELRQYRRVDGNVDAQYSVSHFKAFPSEPRSDGSASINPVHRIYARTRPRMPSSLNSGAWKSGAILLLTVAAVALAVLSNCGFGLTAEAATTQSKITLVVPQGSFADP